jgi:hypothetical protein
MMNRRQAEYFEHRNYIESNKLHELIPFNIDDDYEEGVYDAVRGTLTRPFPPEPADLARLHKLLRTRMVFTVVEFGVGFSTLAIADALSKNEKEWMSNVRPEIRNRYMFQLFSVDTSAEWIRQVQARIPEHLAGRVHFWHTEAEIGVHLGQLCHYYKTLPDVVADFYYLDGPHPKDVHGQIRGLSFQCDERTVMAADLLLMESTMLPGTMILVDGRTNNARFLARNFRRRWRIKWNQMEDYTLFELDEERLGKYNVLGADFFKCD